MRRFLTSVLNTLPFRACLSVGASVEVWCLGRCSARDAPSYEMHHFSVETFFDVEDLFFWRSHFFFWYRLAMVLGTTTAAGGVGC